MTRSATLALALALLASACTEDAAVPTEEGGGAAGDVLGGEISDAMIPLEQIDSQAPLAPRQGPTPADLDAQQPDIAGEAAPESEEAEAAPAAPAPEPAPTE